MLQTRDATRARRQRVDVRRADARWIAFWTIVALAWVALLVMHRGHAQSHDTVTVIAMWALMSVAMMAPTAVPMLATLSDVLTGGSRSPWWSFLAGYVAVWLGFSGLASALQLWLVDRQLVGHDGASASAWLSAGTLLAAGAYQFSSIKQRCLRQCTRPMTFLMRFWRDGVAGAWSMGLRHGAACVGCCWLLMLLAFVGGVASVAFMALATALMVVEKLPSVGRRLAVPLGIVLIAAGLAFVAVALTGDPTVSQHHH